MPTNTLTDSKCKTAKPAQKPYKLFDGGGLHLWVSPKGAKVWRLAYRLNGKPKTISFGDYPAVSLAAARAKRDEVKAGLREGADPMQPRKAQASRLSFEDAAMQYWEGRHDISPSYRSNAINAIKMHLCPALGARGINSITRDDLLAELRKMDANGHFVYVRKARMWVSQVFEWALENGYCTSNPAAMIRPEKAFGKAPVKNFAAVDITEVPELLQRLSIENDLQSVLACRLLALTWVRTVELRMMEWVEIDRDIWRIPAAKMKRRRDHIVPLSAQALAILDQLRARARGSKYVFSAEHRLDRPISENAILMLLYRMGYKGRMTGHGWRTIGSTWANERGYSPDAIERQLAHAPDDKVRSTYNRAEYLTERRKLLQDWADWLDSLVTD